MFKKGHALLAKAACAFFSVLAVGAAKAAVRDLNSMVDADKGYVITGLGDNGSDVAVVFTNHVDSAKWIVPAQLENVHFLVVGGGGGGGGVATNGSVEQGGAGGGGGGVVTGYIKELPDNAVVDVVVGAGGAGGRKNVDPDCRTEEPGTDTASEDAAGASHAGDNSIFYVDNVEYIVAYGGGRDLGVGKVGGVGGSCAGSRLKNGALANPTRGAIGADAANSLSNVKIYGTKGGPANYSDLASGGGGGAVTYSVGTYDAGGSWADSDTIHVGGRGGRGLLSSITGTSLYYGSGASGGSSTDTYSSCLERTGEGAGAGGYGEFAATDAVANQGGGGGGGGGLSSMSGYTGNGGNGGSGIVVFRFTLPAKPVVAATQDLAYTGGQLRGVYEGFGYTLSGTVAATEVGTYTATATLDAGYNMWSDGTTDRVLTIEWRIWPASLVAANYGYTVRGLGETGEEVAVVFTNHNAEVMTWTPPRDLRSVRFLVVGGGGGGGADSSDKDNQNGGAGGGGGGVVTGIVKRLSKGDLVSVEIGKGGVGGKPGHDPESGDGRGAGAVLEYSENSLFKINDLLYVEALRGGNDIGADGPTETQSGGSGAGNRDTKRVGGKAEASYIIKSDNVFGEFFGNDGGDRRGGYGSGGGGGALSVGGDAISEGVVYKGGDGGRGIESFITGERVVYGSGGGGGTALGDEGGQGGEGAGNGNKEHQGAGESARPNQGGGGGGAGGGEGKKYGGNGGSGIVVFRFRLRPPTFRVIVR